MMVLGCAQHKANEAPPQPVGPPRAESLVAAGKFRAVVIEDMDNDGNLDIVGGAASPGMVTISYGDGKGAVSEPQVLPVHGEVRSVAVADFNGDGLNDIAFSVQKETFGIRLWMNQPNRHWQQQNGPVKINQYENIQTADVNADGHMDIIAANASEDKKAGLQVWLGNGKGGWIVETGPTTLGRYIGVAIADVNKDGFPDVIGAGWGLHGALRVWLGDGKGRWTSTPPLSTGNYYGVSTGDINSDGNLDVLAAAFQAGVQTFLGDGNGNFEKGVGPTADVKRRKRTNTTPGTPKLPFPGSPSFWHVLPLDLDDDDFVDLVASSLDNRGIIALRNKSDLGWELIKGKFPASGNYYGLALADLNADGYAEICAANFGEGIQILPGNSGKAIQTRQMEIEQLPTVDRLAVLAAPTENKVFKTTNGYVEYKIGPGDVLEITYWEGTTATREEILVRPDGNISFRFVEDVPVAGLTARELDQRLTQRLKNYIRKPKIDVVIKEHNSKSITLLGAITYRHAAGTGPGEYRLKGRTTLLELVTRAGGPTVNADLSIVSVRRDNGESISVNLFKAIQQGDPGKDFILDDRDVIFIPTLSADGNRIHVFGEVENPGTYTFKGADIRLADVIAEAGGPTVFATESDTRVVRGDITRPEIISANLDRLIQEGDQSQNVALVSGDLVYVPRSRLGNFNRFWEQVKPIFDLLSAPGRTWNVYND
jgi:protein involved in polysaccharide export with SLBB domain